MCVRASASRACARARVCHPIGVVERQSRELRKTEKAGADKRLEGPFCF